MQKIIGHWLASLRHYALMCLLLSSPARLPYNPYSFTLTVIAYFSLGLLFVDERSGYAVIAARILLDLAMLAAIAQVGLRLKQLPERFPQTFSALVGINLLMTAIMYPLQAMMVADADQGPGIADYLFIAVLIWNLAAISLVLKRAFEISTPLSAMISFGYFVVNYIILVLFL